MRFVLLCCFYKQKLMCIQFGFDTQASKRKVSAIEGKSIPPIVSKKKELKASLSIQVICGLSSMKPHSIKSKGWVLEGCASDSTRMMIKSYPQKQCLQNQSLFLRLPMDFAPCAFPCLPLLLYPPARNLRDFTIPFLLITLL